MRAVATNLYKTPKQIEINNNRSLRFFGALYISLDVSLLRVLSFGFPDLIVQLLDCYNQNLIISFSVMQFKFICEEFSNHLIVFHCIF